MADNGSLRAPLAHDEALAVLVRIYGERLDEGIIENVLQQKQGDLEITAHELAKYCHDDPDDESLKDDNPEDQKIGALSAEDPSPLYCILCDACFFSAEALREHQCAGPHPQDTTGNIRSDLQGSAWDEEEPVVRSACPPWATTGNNSRPAQTSSPMMAAQENETSAGNDENHGAEDADDDSDDWILRKVVAPRAEAFAADIRARPHRRLRFFARPTVAGVVKSSKAKRRERETANHVGGANEAETRDCEDDLNNDETQTPNIGTTGSMQIPELGAEWEGVRFRFPSFPRINSGMGISLSDLAEDTVGDWVRGTIVVPIITNTIRLESICVRLMGQGMGRLLHGILIKIPVALACFMFCAVLAIPTSAFWPILNLWEFLFWNDDDDDGGADDCSPCAPFFLGSTCCLLVVSPIFFVFLCCFWGGGLRRVYVRLSREHHQTVQAREETESELPLMSLFVEDAFKEWVWSLIERLAQRLAVFEEKCSKTLGTFLGPVVCCLLVELPLIVASLTFALVTGPFVALWVVFAVWEDIFWEKEWAIFLDWLWRGLVFCVLLAWWLCLFPLIFVCLVAGFLRKYVGFRREHREQSRPDVETGPEEEEEEPRLSRAIQVAFYQSAADCTRQWFKGTRVVEDTFVKRLGCLVGRCLYWLLMEIPAIIAYFVASLVLLPFAFFWIVFKLWEDILLEPESPGCRNAAMRLLGFLALLLFNVAVVLPGGFLLQIVKYFLERRRNRKHTVEFAEDAVVGVLVPQY